MQEEYYFHQKYRISSNRMTKNFYTTGMYFITICTKDRQPYFGEIRDGKMIKNEMGMIAHENWLHIPDHFPHVKIDKFVIMPNHVHGIIVVGPVTDMAWRKDVALQYLSRDGIGDVIRDRMSLSISPQKGTLGTIIRSYKSACTYIINKSNRGYFTWHTNYYDHIIRNEQELERIRTYIKNNPTKWDINRNNQSDIYV